MIENLLQFLSFVTSRDKSKWYAFSIFDICIFLFTGIGYFLLDWKNTAPIAWTYIIATNAVETYYYNKTPE